MSHELSRQIAHSHNVYVQHFAYYKHISRTRRVISFHDLLYFMYNNNFFFFASLIRFLFLSFSCIPFSDWICFSSLCRSLQAAYGKLWAKCRTGRGKNTTQQTNHHHRFKALRSFNFDRINERKKINITKAN